MPAVFTNGGLFTFRKLTDTQTLPTQPWFIALSPLVQPWPPKVPYAKSVHQNRHRLCVLKRKGDFQQAVSMREGCNKWQMKALSLLHRQGCPFMRGYFKAEFTRRNACAGWVFVFPIERNKFEARAAPPGMNQTSTYEWRHWKRVYWTKILGSKSYDIYQLTMKSSLGA